MEIAIGVEDSIIRVDGGNDLIDIDMSVKKLLALKKVIFILG